MEKYHAIAASAESELEKDHKEHKIIEQVTQQFFTSATETINGFNWPNVGVQIHS